jgi:hypothetical protein
VASPPMPPPAIRIGNPVAFAIDHFLASPQDFLLSLRTGKITGNLQKCAAIAGAERSKDAAAARV